MKVRVADTNSTNAAFDTPTFQLVTAPQIMSRRITQLAGVSYSWLGSYAIQRTDDGVGEAGRRPAAADIPRELALVAVAHDLTTREINILVVLVSLSKSSRYVVCLKKYLFQRTICTGMVFCY